MYAAFEPHIEQAEPLRLPTTDLRKPPNPQFGGSIRSEGITGPCPRDIEAIATSGRRCLKKCQTDSDCNGRRKKCMCDDMCGQSCVNPVRACPKPKEPKNGQIEELSDRHHMFLFGTRIHYSCDRGHYLDGPQVRFCQGDKNWSGWEPKCQAVSSGVSP
ncbi:PREDICTED: protein lev-9-like, partial [Priapulus caudatus]|uniref:Protein lev-9-like n=1 Tax=Priapulus caudatus TaxID=37621 RepID=A0ABM1EVN1_PRICU